jgi:hypothetical protein
VKKQSQFWRKVERLCPGLVQDGSLFSSFTESSASLYMVLSGVNP